MILLTVLFKDTQIKVMDILNAPSGFGTESILFLMAKCPILTTALF